MEGEDACSRGSRACGLSFTEVERMIIIEKVCLTFVLLQVEEDPYYHEMIIAYLCLSLSSSFSEKSCRAVLPDEGS